MEGSATQRLDKWLWFARFVKTRSLAAKLCSRGSVSVSGEPALKPNHSLRIGDELAVTQGRFVRRVTVLSLGDRRGPAAEARLLYAEPQPPVLLAQDDWQPLLEEE